MSVAVIDRVYGVIRVVLDAPDLVISADQAATDIPGWDSFAHVNIIVDIEDEFGITFSTEEIGKSAQVGQLVGMVVAKTRV